MGNYTLQKYKGTATRHTCPNCGDRRSFTYYVDESGTPLHPSVGRCNHESSCGYHYTPKEYFHDHPECRTANGFSFDRQKSEQKSVQKPRQAATGRVRTGKVMQYNPNDGHRVKDGQASAVDWIHSLLKRRHELAEEWQLSQCLFGEHLLGTYPDKVVVLVESEKSAVIGSAIFPGYVWLATGGKSQLREEKLRVLTGRTVLLFPDADGYAEWKQRAGSMTYCKTVVSDIIEKNATPEQKAAHIDIADWIVFQIRESKINCTADHLVEAERILCRMIEKNPVLQKLIDDFDLVLVGASPIGNSGENPP